MSIISTVYLKVLWVKKTYSFNWAHKPLCKKYEEDLIKIKSIYICRSCFFVYLGMIMCFIFSIIFRNFFIEYGVFFLGGLLSFTLPLSYPTLYKLLPRKFRDLTRFSMGYIIIQIFLVLLFGHFMIALGVILLSYSFWKIYFKQRAKRKIKLCSSCNEYSEVKVCSGYITQQSSIREYEEEATEYILRTGYIPKILK